LATDIVKAPVLSDLVKSEQPNYLGREAAKVTSATALKLGTVLQGGPDAAVPWDLSDPEDIYAILLEPVPAGASALAVPVLYAGPASLNPAYLSWDAAAVDADIEAALGELKARRFIFTREALTDALYPGQIDRVSS
jgi:hypothetical protein